MQSLNPSYAPASHHATSHILAHNFIEQNPSYKLSGVKIAVQRLFNVKCNLRKVSAFYTKFIYKPQTVVVSDH